MRFALALICLLAAAPAFAQTPSIKEDFKDAGRAVGDGFKGGYENTKDATVHTYDKAKHGVGTAMEKTGEGLDKAGSKVEDAGEDVKEDAE